MVMDETLYGVQGKLQNFAVIYLGELRGDGRTVQSGILTRVRIIRSRHHQGTRL